MSVPYAFGIVFVSSLLLPQQPGLTSDTFWAAAVLAFTAYRVLTTRSRNVSAPRSAVIPWVILLGFMAATTAMSGSIGLSVPVFLRYAGAFAVFLLFSSEPESAGRTVKAFRTSGLLLAAAFTGFFIAGALVNGMPVNGLVSRTGHHPASYGFVALLPFLFGPIRRHTQGFAAAGVLTALFLTGSRIAAAAGAAYALFLGYRSDGRARTVSLIVAAATLAVFGVFTLTGSVRQETHERLDGIAVLRAYMKERSRDRLRVEYVSQALSSLREHPMQGYGPGTFELISRRYQRGPGLHSAFAHSYPLQFLAENGIPALIALAYLLFTVLRSAVRHLRLPADPRFPVAAGTVLLVAYSVMDGPLDAAPYLMLFAAFTGILSRNTGKTVSVPLAAPAAPLLLFFTGMATSLILGFMKYPDAAFLAAPYRKDAALTLSRSSLLRYPATGQALAFFHARDPDVLVSHAGLSNEYSVLYVQSINYDQYNYPYWRAMLSAMVTGHPDGIPDALCRLSRLHDPAFGCGGFFTPSFTAYLRTPSFQQTLGSLTERYGAAKFFYFLGLTAHEAGDDRDFDIDLLRLAKHTGPEWACLYLELASANLYWQNYRMDAKQTLADCMNNPNIRDGCAFTGGDIDNLNLPGSCRSDIIAIPALLP